MMPGDKTGMTGWQAGCDGNGGVEERRRGMMGMGLGGEKSPGVGG